MEMFLLKFASVNSIRKYRSMISIVCAPYVLTGSCLHHRPPDNFMLNRERDTGPVVCVSIGSAQIHCEIMPVLNMQCIVQYYSLSTLNENHTHGECFQFLGAANCSCTQAAS